jgi:putative flippase GtrA
MNVELGRLIRYGITGGLTASLYFGAVGAAVEIFDIAPVPASVLGQVVTIVAAYYGHALFSFRVKPDRLYFLRFVFITLTAILLNIAVVWGLSVLLAVPYAFVIVLVAILVPLYSYLCNRFWVFLPGLDAGLANDDGSFARPVKSTKLDGAN